MSQHHSVNAVFEELQDLVETLKQIKGEVYRKNDAKSFEALTWNEKRYFGRECEALLKDMHGVLFEILERNRDILGNFVESTRSLMTYESSYDKLIEIKKKLIESESGFDGILPSLLLDLKGVIESTSDVLEEVVKCARCDATFQSGERRRVKVNGLRNRLKKCNNDYKGLGTIIVTVKADINDVLQEHAKRVSDCRDMIKYLEGESNFFPGEEGNFLDDLFGRPNAEVETYLRHLVNENLARRDSSLEHLYISQKWHNEYLKELNGLKICITDIMLHNILFQKFRNTKIFDIVDKFETLLTTYNDCLKSSKPSITLSYTTNI